MQFVRNLCSQATSSRPCSMWQGNLVHPVPVSPTCVTLYKGMMHVIIRLEARLQPNIGNPLGVLRPVLMVLTRSGITPPKVNRFGWNLEHSEHIPRGWPRQILGAICTVARAGEPRKFLSGKQGTILLISRRPNFTKFEHNTPVSRWILSEQNF